MMYPRLKLLHRLLAESGSIWVSIDDNAVGLLRPIMDEIFGVGNFVANIIWEKADSPRNSARQFSVDHDYILAYSKNPDWQPARLPRTKEANSIYQNPDNDPRGPWIPGDPYANKPYSKGQYAISGPTGRKFSPPPGRFWRISEERLRELNEDGRIWWGPKKDARPSIKRYLNEVADLVPRTIWTKEQVGSNRSSKNELRSIFPDTSSFDTPKPSALIERILQIAAGKDAVILDSFAGSGTTAHAVLKLNAVDGGNRRFILIEMEDYAETVTAERVRRVIKGYGQGNSPVAGLGGSFDYYIVGERLLQEDGMLNPAAGLSAIRDYVAWTEGIPIGRCAPLTPTITEGNASSPYWLGEAHGLGLFFVWENNRATTLDLSLLTRLIKHPGRYVIYADQCALGADFMRRHNIVYKKIPRDITRL